MKSKGIKRFFWISFGLYLMAVGYWIAGLISEVAYHSTVYPIAMLLFVLGITWAYTFDHGYQNGYDLGRFHQVEEFEKAFKRDKTVREVYFKALMEIGDWENYNLGGDPAGPGGWHPAKVAEGAFEQIRFMDTGEVERAPITLGMMDRSYSSGVYDTVNKLVDGHEIRTPTKTIQIVDGKLEVR